MQNINPILFLDSYKLDHRRQYPANTTLVYSNLTPRAQKYLKSDRVYLFGLQYFIKEYLIERFQRDFFDRPLEEVLVEYQEILNHHLGPNNIGVDHIEDLHKLGYLPIRIKAIEEGDSVKINHPLLTIYNTHPKFFWLTNYLETILSAVLWMPCTNATSAKLFRNGLDEFAEKTCDSNALVDFQGHDFSFRGMSSCESALLSGAAHLIHFKGTDCVPALAFIKKYYGGQLPAGFSVAATEHSVTSMSLADKGEYEFFVKLIRDLYPTGILSIVSDTWDYWQVLTEYLPRLRNLILQRHDDGKQAGIFSKVVIRPDAGDPNLIVNGDPFSSNFAANQGSLRLLEKVFGSTTNNKGYKELHPAIGLIYGDSINLERQRLILETMEANGFASSNIVFGVGSYHYQYQTRDAFGMAVKATYGETRVEGAHGFATVGHNIFKDPKTDLDSMKKSHKGLLCITDKDELIQECSWGQEATGRLQTVFDNGKLIKEITFDQIRENAGY